MAEIKKNDDLGFGFSLNITQSMLKGIYDVRMGDECGLVFQKKFIDKRFDLFPPSEAMKLGIWFEYMATGSKPKSGEIPVPETLKTLGKDGKPQLGEKYKKAAKHVENFKKLIKYYGIKIISVGKDIEFGGLSGTLDIEAEATIDIYSEGQLIAKAGDKLIIDMKFSGLLDDKWSDFGWNLDMLNTKAKIVLQPIHYLLIGRNLWKDYNVKFLFFLFSSTNDYDHRIIDFRVDDEHFDTHIDFINKSLVWLKFWMEKGFPAHADYLRCFDCPLKVGCEHFMSVPKIVVHEYNNEIDK